MKKLLLFLVFAAFSFTGISQDLPDIQNIKLKKKKDYAESEGYVLQAANYVFAHPFVNDDINRSKATAFVLKWMEGTPDYTFEIGPEAMDIVKGNDDLFGYYIVGLTKVSLDNKESDLDNDELHNKTMQLLMDYCSNKDNNLKPTKAMKKLMK